MPPGPMLGPPRMEIALDEAWRVVFAISATAVVAGGAFFAIRFIMALHL